MNCVPMRTAGRPVRMKTRPTHPTSRIQAMKRTIEHHENVIAIHRIMTLALLMVLTWGYMTNFGRY